MDMTNHQNHKKTIIETSPYRVDIGLDKQIFSSLGLDQIRLSAIEAEPK
jgi:hypothetical protein